MLRASANLLGLAWWARVESRNPDVTYWFGPFVRHAGAGRTFLSDLRSESPAVLEHQLLRTRSNPSPSSTGKADQHRRLDGVRASAALRYAHRRLVDALRNGSVTAKEHSEQALERIAATEPELKRSSTSPVIRPRPRRWTKRSPPSKTLASSGHHWHKDNLHQGVTTTCSACWRILCPTNR